MRVYRIKAESLTNIRKKPKRKGCVWEFDVFSPSFGKKFTLKVSKMGEEIRVITNSSVNLIVSSSFNEYSAEKRFQKSLTVAELKGRLELITGALPATMKLELFGKDNVRLACLDEDALLLGSYPADDGMRLHVIDKGPRLTEMQDLSNVPKQDLTDEEYAKRNDTVRAYLVRNKLGKYGASGEEDVSAEERQARLDEELLAKSVTVGERCQVTLKGQPTKRGDVKFVGKTDFQPGWWIGIQYDEPVGKNDGSVGGRNYFSCPPKFGAFVKPQHVTVGDFPVEFDPDEM